MRVEALYEINANNQTLGEPWHVEREPRHWYGASADFALKHLGLGPGQCLVIGSPVFEAVELQEAGWDVTYLDVRKPPLIDKYVIGDGSKMPFPDESFDVVSTSCVLCHAGLGRYGDLVDDLADQKMLCEIRRVLKRGGHAAVSFGPVADLPMPARIGTCHRVYTVDEAERMLAAAELEALKMLIWDARNNCWRSRPTRDVREPDYLSMLVRKHG